LIFAAYSAGTVLSLFLAGSLSDLYGRRTVLIPAVLVGTAGAAIFLVWRDVPGLYVGRFLSGLSIGAVSAAATAYETELHIKSRPGGSIRRAQIAASTTNIAGFGLGALIAGLLAADVFDPLGTVYVVFLCALALSAVALSVCPETLTRPDPLPPYRLQRISVPAAARTQYVGSVAGAFVAFSGTGLFGGLAGTFLVGTLHRRSLALIGTAVFIVFAAGVVVQFLTITWSTGAVLLTGIPTLLVGLGLVVLSAWLTTPSLAAFLVGGAIVGAGSGCIFKASLGTVIAISDPADRAQSVAGLLLFGYLGLSLPVIGVGLALRQASVKTTLLGFTIVDALILLAVTPALLRSHKVAQSLPA
jgi:Major Facilitator Superfamily